jgi:hypothetical protein
VVNHGRDVWERKKGVAERVLLLVCSTRTCMPEEWIASMMLCAFVSVVSNAWGRRVSHIEEKLSTYRFYNTYGRRKIPSGDCHLSCRERLRRLGKTIQQSQLEYGRSFMTSRLGSSRFPSPRTSTRAVSYSNYRSLLCPDIISPHGF